MMRTVLHPGCSSLHLRVWPEEAEELRPGHRGQLSGKAEHQQVDGDEPQDGEGRPDVPVRHHPGLLL